MHTYKDKPIRHTLDSYILRSLALCACFIGLALSILTYSLVYSSTIRNLPDAVMQKALSTEKGGGLWTLSQLISEGPERLWIVQPSTPEERQQKKLGKGEPSFAARIVVDVSWDLEFSFLLSSMKKRDWISNKVIDFEPYVVDLGAFDGKLSSNSYNFFQLGTQWKGLLVEASTINMNLAKDNTAKFLIAGNDIHYENCFVQDKELGVNDPTTTKLRVGVNPMQNSQFKTRIDVRSDQHTKLGGLLETEKDADGEYLNVQVKSIKEIMETNNVPKRFAVLDVDIEGMDWEILTTIMSLGYQPQYVVVEIGNDWELVGYEFVARIHYNRVFRRKDL